MNETVKAIQEELQKQGLESQPGSINYSLVLAIVLGLKKKPIK
ncbi:MULTISPECIES: hypothetical protein [Levilactobacillus]|uniref:Uncharacterized protein n=1 Tax=Levilactobacillus namurensis TaxID=380393 RepID=A0AAW8W3T9_9LACO|nr:MULTISPECIES: hypothetical protein [Levilactobacillus]MDT7014686.1 hypothetical protein [Levilactobacillus namurensis]